MYCKSTGINPPSLTYACNVRTIQDPVMPEPRYYRKRAHIDRHTGYMIMNVE